MSILCFIVDHPIRTPYNALDRSGKFDVVVVYKLDRLTRSVKDLGYLIDLFEKSGVAFSSVSDNLTLLQLMGNYCTDNLILNIIENTNYLELGQVPQAASL
jgi:DNA invertase Pin-like site-specific DNA recombinase